MPLGMLPIRMERCFATGIPARQLRIQCHVKNTNPHPVCILDAWITAATRKGALLAEGRFYVRKPHRWGEAPIGQNEEEMGEIVIPLSDGVLRHIEGIREGHDVRLSIDAKVWASSCSRDQPKNAWTMALPTQTAFCQGNRTPFEYEIPQSDWVKLLKTMGWSELELLEIPMAKLRSTPMLSRALQHFDAAQDCFRRGDWDGTMADCRKVFEAAVKDISGKDDMKQGGQEAFRKLIPDQSKADTLNETTEKFGKYLHLGRHEGLPKVTITPADARLSLYFTGALLSYLGRG